MTTDPARGGSEAAASRARRFWTRDEERLASREELTDAQVTELTGRSLVAVRGKRQQLRFRRRPIWQHKTH